MQTEGFEYGGAGGALCSISDVTVLKFYVNLLTLPMLRYDQIKRCLNHSKKWGSTGNLSWLHILSFFVCLCFVQF